MCLPARKWEKSKWKEPNQVLLCSTFIIIFRSFYWIESARIRARNPEKNHSYHLLYWNFACLHRAFFSLVFNLIRSFSIYMHSFRVSVVFENIYLSYSHVACNWANFCPRNPVELFFFPVELISFRWDMQKKNIER